MVKIELCRESGFRASENCPNIDTSLVPTKCLQSLACPYHKVILLDKLKKFRVDSDCESFENIQHQVFFVLPPLVEKYYKQSHPNFIAVPNYKADCLSKVADKSMYLIYPKKDAKIIIPIQIDETKGRTVFEATHKNPSIKIYWHLDNEFIGTTTQIHQITLNPSEGKHLLTIIDENGVSQNCNFEVVGENNLAQ
jgi:penicillin-binding protein 1C